MPLFNNLDDLGKHINGKGQSSILDDSSVKKILIEAGRTLERYLKEELNSYFNSYEPVEYQRTGYTMESFRVSEPRKVNETEWSIEIYFFDGLANHPSYIGDNQPDGYTPWLLHSGWRTKLDSSLNIENFTRFKGTNYITKAVDRFNKSNKYGMKVQVYKGGQDVTGRNYSYGK